MNHKIHEYRCVTKISSARSVLHAVLKQQQQLYCFFNRLKKLDKFHDSIIEELEKLEKDSQSLKELEKEFAVCVFKNLKIILKPQRFLVSVM